MMFMKCECDRVEEGGGGGGGGGGRVEVRWGRDREDGVRDYTHEEWRGGEEGRAEKPWCVHSSERTNSDKK